MKVKRTMVVNVDKFEVGDIIKFKLANGEKVEAMAVKEISGGMLFVMVNCLKEEKPMFKSIEGMSEDDITYVNSDLREVLNDEILNQFPEKIRERMMPANEEKDMLRVPTECEIFGQNFCGELETYNVVQWKPMKNRLNRIAFHGKKGNWGTYWLMTHYEEYPSYFVNVRQKGDVDSSEASCSHGVRPVFALSHS